jgi:hypothetical protein
MTLINTNLNMVSLTASNLEVNGIFLFKEISYL